MRLLVLHLILAAAVASHPTPRQVERTITAQAATSGTTVRWRKEGIPVWVVPGWQIASHRFCGVPDLLGCEAVWQATGPAGAWRQGRLAVVAVIAQDWSQHLTYELEPFMSNQEPEVQP
jgi:hypothetical protein